MSRARFFDTPSVISSSSVQHVPSTSTQAAAFMAAHTASSMAPKPGAYNTDLAVAASVIASATLSPGATDSRFGEYGAGLLATGSARQRTPATPSTVNSSP